MRVLLDTCVWRGVRDLLAASGHDAVWVGDWPTDPGDAAILAAAHAENRVLVTLDNDFGHLAVALGQPHCGIVRLEKVTTSQQGTVAAQVLNAHAAELARGAIITADASRVRIRIP